MKRQSKTPDFGRRGRDTSVREEPKPTAVERLRSIGLWPQKKKEVRGSGLKRSRDK